MATVVGALAAGEFADTGMLPLELWRHESGSLNDNLDRSLNRQLKLAIE